MTESITRLHISPLNPALLDSILVPSIRPVTTDISFHNIPTFPENDYGFISLPAMEAEKLKKKLNGSILKGKKFKVEVAREDPKKEKKKARKDDIDEISEKASSPKLKEKKSSKRKADNAVLDGYELPADRHVKRGWTEPLSAKKLKKQNKTDKEARKAKLQSKSKYTEKAECLFKTRTPPNMTSDATLKKNTKSKKPKAANEVIIHEFAQTVTHPSFLKSTTGGKPVTAGYEDGKGWVDEDGGLVEGMDNKKLKSADYRPGVIDGAKEKVAVKDKSRGKKEHKSTSLSESEKEKDESDWTSSSGSSDSESSGSEDESDSESDASSSGDDSSLSQLQKKADTTNTPADEKTMKTKAVASSDESEDEPEDESDHKPEVEGNDSSSDSAEDDEDDESEDSSEADSDAKPSPKQAETTTESKEVHPLEALFKRTTSENDVSEETKNASFSFFTGNDDDIEDEDEEEAEPASLEPLTPYTKRDRQTRGLRSGAPTPDTAGFNRHKFIIPSEGEDEDEDEDEEMGDVNVNDYDHAQILGDGTPSKSRVQAASQQPPEESDFVKWFWEHRGDNNRAWKRRRREAAKDKRQRENRRKGMKGRG